MLRIKITDFGTKPKEEAIKDLLDCRYIVCYNSEGTQDVTLCKTKTQVFTELEKQNESVFKVLELYEGSISDDDYVCFLTKNFEQDN